MQRPRKGERPEPKHSFACLHCSACSPTSLESRRGPFVGGRRECHRVSLGGNFITCGACQIRQQRSGWRGARTLPGSRRTKSALLHPSCYGEFQQEGRPGVEVQKRSTARATAFPPP